MNACCTLLTAPACMRAVTMALRNAPSRQLPAMWDALVDVLRVLVASDRDPVPVPTVSLVTTVFVRLSQEVLVNDVNAVAWHRRCKLLLSDVAYPALAPLASVVHTAVALQAAAAATDLAFVCGRFIHLHQRTLRKLQDFVITPSSSAGNVPGLPVPLDRIAAAVSRWVAAAPAAGAGAPSKKHRRGSSSAPDARLVKLLQCGWLRCACHELVLEHRRLTTSHVAPDAPEAAHAVALANRLLSPFPLPGVPPVHHLACFTPQFPIVAAYADVGALEEFCTWLVVTATTPVPPGFPARRAGAAAASAFCSDAQLLESRKVAAAVATAAAVSAAEAGAALAAALTPSPCASAAAAACAAVDPDDLPDAASAAALLDALPTGGDTVLCSVAPAASPESLLAAVTCATARLHYIAALPAAAVPPTQAPAVVLVACAVHRMATGLTPSPHAVDRAAHGHAPPPGTKKRQRAASAGAGAGAAGAAATKDLMDALEALLPVAWDAVAAATSACGAADSATGALVVGGRNPVLPWALDRLAQQQRQLHHHRSTSSAAAAASEDRALSEVVGVVTRAALPSAAGAGHPAAVAALAAAVGGVVAGDGHGHKGDPCPPIPVRCTVSFFTGVSESWGGARDHAADGHAPIVDATRAAAAAAAHWAERALAHRPADGLEVLEALRRVHDAGVAPDLAAALPGTGHVLDAALPRGAALSPGPGVLLPLCRLVGDERLSDARFHKLLAALTTLTASEQTHTVPVQLALRNHLHRASLAQMTAVFQAVQAELLAFPGQTAMLLNDAPVWYRLAAVCAALHEAMHSAAMPLLTSAEDAEAVRFCVVNHVEPVLGAALPVLSHVLQHHSLCAAGSAAAGCGRAIVETAVAVLGKPQAFRMPGSFVASLMGAVAACGATPEGRRAAMAPALLKSCSLLLYTAVRHHTRAFLDAVPVFVAAATGLIRAALRCRDDPAELDDASYVSRMVEAATTTHTDVMRRYSGHLLAEYVDACSVRMPASAVREAVRGAVNALFACASPHELQVVHLVSSAAGRAVLKADHEHYETHVQYTGKA